MPRARQPRPLQELCADATSALVRRACVSIHDRRGDSPGRIDDARTLRRHLVEAAWPMLDRLRDRVFSRDDGWEVTDVLLLALVHARTRTLRYRKANVGVGRDHELWEALIVETPNLSELDLSGVDYSIDGILRIVGTRCFQLEEICIGEGKVSQRGLCYLAAVDTLRVIKNSYPNLLYVTKNANDLPCVRLLLRSLPLLEHVHCSCMGEILADLQCKGPLALTRCWETQPTPRKIDAIARLCPHLARLELGHSIVYNRSFDPAPLTESDISVSSLKLTDFRFSESLENYFAVKGHHLRELEMYNLDEIKFEQILAIGRHCRNLDVLKIHLELYYESSYSPRGAKRANVVEERLFGKLSHFEFDVDGQSDAIEMLACLAAAKRIQTFTVRTQSFSGFHDENALERVLSELIRTNPMAVLESLILVGPFRLSKELIEYFYNLSDLAAWKLDLCLTPEVDEFLEGLRNRILQNHLELRYLR